MQISVSSCYVSYAKCEHVQVPGPLCYQTTDFYKCATRLPYKNVNVCSSDVLIYCRNCTDRKSNVDKNELYFYKFMTRNPFISFWLHLGDATIVEVSFA